jgi:long-chain fatty acid transport protein
MAGAVLMLAGTSIASAGGFALREQSAYGQGSSFAGIAAGGSLSSSFWNPATLDQVTGIQTESNMTLVVPISDVTVTTFGTNEGDIGIDALVPSSYAAYRLNDRAVIGVGLNGPFGLATKYDTGSPIRTNGIAGTSKIFSLNVNPMISYALTDSLVIGVGGQAQYIDLKYTSVNLGGALGISALTGDDVAFGFTAGILWKPMDGTEIGIGYRSSIEHDLEGTLNTTGLGALGATAEFSLPDMVTLGIRQRINDNWRVMAGVEWSNWSRFDVATVNTAPTGNFNLPFGYDDGWYFSGGVEYDYSDALTLRTGIGYELSPISDGVRSYQLPDNDRLWLSAGLSYEASEKLSLDAGYSYLNVIDTPINVSGVQGNSDGQVHIFSVAFKYKWGERAAMDGNGAY